MMCSLGATAQDQNPKQKCKRVKSVVVKKVTKEGSDSSVVKKKAKSDQVTQMTAEEQKLLDENPIVHSVLSKLLDQRLKNIVQNGLTEGKSSKTPQKDVINRARKVVKSPSDTTIYAPALTRLSNSNTHVPNEIQISNFVGAVRSQLNNGENREERPSTSGVQNNAGCGPVRQVNTDIPMTSTTETAQKYAENSVIDAEKFQAGIAIPPTGNNQLLHLNNQIAHMLVDNVDNGNEANNASQGHNNQMAHLLVDSGNEANNASQGHNIVQQPFSCQQNEFALAQGSFMPPLPPSTPNFHQQGSHLIPNIGSGVSDDDFFHLTCHIEPSLKHKIEKGEFVELEKLLPKDRTQFSQGGAKENRLEWVQRDGNTYLVSAGRDAKISGIRRWEQAFRAYATIYCAANPHRSKEIWQYIAVINTAASAYSWDNVYNYDITFRHLMAFNPNRSWAVTYNQMWNLSMRDPLPKNQGHKGFFQFNSSRASSSSGSSATGNSSYKKKSDYCWNFNRGVPCKYGKRCKFIEKCSYCDSPTHGVNVCKKLEQKEQRKNSKGNEAHSSSPHKKSQ